MLLWQNRRWSAAHADVKNIEEIIQMFNFHFSIYGRGKINIYEIAHYCYKDNKRLFSISFILKSGSIVNWDYNIKVERDRELAFLDGYICGLMVKHEIPHFDTNINDFELQQEN
jgi:hypothetical protein